jgi:hypothetical protein
VATAGGNRGLSARRYRPCHNSLKAETRVRSLMESSCFASCACFAPDDARLRGPCREPGRQRPCHHLTCPVGDSNPCRPGVHCLSSDHQQRRIHRTVSERERAPVQASCLSRCGGRVTKTVTTGRDSPLSQGATALHRVTGNYSILLTEHHGTARHSQLPKLDVVRGRLRVCPLTFDGMRALRLRTR